MNENDAKTLKTRIKMYVFNNFICRLQINVVSLQGVFKKQERKKTLYNNVHVHLINV